MPDRRHQNFGLMIVSCDHADLRLTPDGVMIYDDQAPRLERTPVPAIPRAEVIDEFYDAAVSDRPPLHSGAWALGTLEVCLAILRSARERTDIALDHQSGIRQ